jgi:uncharacterized protein YceK
MRLLITPLLVFTLSGCSGLLARTGENSQTGKPLAGLNHATENALLCSLFVLYDFSRH